MSEVERAGLGMAAFPGEDHLRVDEVETTGGDQEGIVAQREAVMEEGTICVCSPAKGRLGTGVSYMDGEQRSQLPWRLVSERADGNAKLLLWKMGEGWVGCLDP